MEAAQMPKGDLIHKCYVKTDFCKRFDSSGINAVLYGIPTYEYNAFNPVKNKFFFSPLYSRDQKNQKRSLLFNLVRDLCGLLRRIFKHTYHYPTTPLVAYSDLVLLRKENFSKAY